MGKYPLEQEKNIIGIESIAVDGNLMAETNINLSHSKKIRLGKIIFGVRGGSKEGPREGAYRVSARRLRRVGKSNNFIDSYTLTRIADNFSAITEGEKRTAWMYEN